MMGEGKGRAIYTYDILLRPVFKNIGIGMFKWGFKGDVVNCLSHYFL